MPEYIIHGIPVNFPFEPYGVQTAYMEKVIECLKKGQNGVLESPTGTGKTLSLLCASLSWLTIRKAQQQAEAHGLYQLPDGDFVSGLQDNLREAAGPLKLSNTNTASWGCGSTKIIYASRTHAQLSQAIQELKKTSYVHTKVAVLGSRDQMCIHPEVSKEQNNIVKMHMCQALTKSRSCYFYTNLDRKKDDPALRAAGIMDIEDLVKSGRKHKVCPYFMARELKNDADIVFMPYNYTLDQKHMKSHEVELANNVVILDEAHNVEKMCEESVSIHIRSTDIALCIEEVTQVMKNLYENAESGADFSHNGDSTPPDFSPEELCILKTMFLELEKIVDDITVESGGSTFAGDYIVGLLAKAEITYEKSSVLIDLLVKIVQYLSVAGNSPFQLKGTAILKIIELLKIVFRTSSGVNRLVHLDQLKRCFKVHVTEEEPKNFKQKSDSWTDIRPTTSKTKGRVISYLCFSPGYGMKQLLENNLRCVILTSGTLSPMAPLLSELDIPVPITLENPHVIGTGQVYVSVVASGPDGHTLNSSYNTRNDPRYISSLGMTVLNICRVVPHGVLVFFQSYPVLYKCQEEWQQSGLWSKITNLKPIFVEPKNRDSFNSTISEYYNKVQDPATKGACFMAVTRGKVSEGLDFMDVNGRAVIVTGLPFPPLMDVYVKLKRKYLQENQGKDKTECLTAEQWYLFEASRAVNQAIGRVIRHKNDYGAILLCDSRFDGTSFKKALSSWVRPHIKKHNSFGPLLRDLRQFFINAEKNLPPPRIKGPAYELKPNMPVAASFDMANSRASTVTKYQSEISAVNDSSSVSEWSLGEYQSKDISGLAKEKKTDLFGALEKPTTVINFNDMSAASSSKSLFKWKDSQEPKAKKMKLKVAPPKVLTSCQVSVDIFTQETNVSKTGVLKQSVSSQPTSSKQSPSKSGAVSDKLSQEIKVAEICAYLKEVKKSLDTTMYRRFSKMTNAYEKNKDFNQLLGILWEVMMKDGRNFKHLFKGFRRFLHVSHRSDFDDFCSTMLLS